MEAADEFGLGFDQIERRAVRLGDRRDQVDGEADELRQDEPEPACACTIPASDVVPARISTPTTDIVIASSYEIICAVERTLPRSGYFEPDDQPASEIPYTPIDVSAKMKRIPALTFPIAPQRSVRLGERDHGEGAHRARKRDQRREPIDQRIGRVRPSSLP